MGSSLTYDAANDVVLVLNASGAYSLNLKTYEWVHAANFPRVPAGQLAAFYDPVLNVHFIYVAVDGQDNGKMLVYRFKPRPL
jgi:hypothetical protein